MKTFFAISVVVITTNLLEIESGPIRTDEVNNQPETDASSDQVTGFPVPDLGASKHHHHRRHSSISIIDSKYESQINCHDDLK